MKRRTMTALCISLSFMLLFTAIGYAALSSEMWISGSVGVLAGDPEGLHISKVEVYSASGAKDTLTDIVLPTSLNTSVQASSRGGSVTYKITVYNKSDMTYWYLGTEALDMVGSNGLIDAQNGITIKTRDHEASNSDAFDLDDWIPPQTERVFYATYTFGSAAQGDISTMVNFKFGLYMGSWSDGFLKVLNDKSGAYGYEYLSGAFDKAYAEDGSTVIGNVGEDKQVFDNLFGSAITVNINGVDMPATVLVERKNVDKNASTGDGYSGSNAPSGCEYTVYITVDGLGNAGGKATVFAVTYTCGANGIWYQIGELYEGECTVRDYDTSDGKYEGAFEVDSWLAVQKEYSVTNDISYKVGYEQGTQYDKLLTIEELMSVKDQEFYNKVNNNSGKLLKPVCNILYSYTHNNGQYIETTNFANSDKQGYEALRRAFDKIKPYCLIANGAQEVKIQNASSLSRAELIQLLEEIQITYEYYLAVNPNG